MEVGCGHGAGLPGVKTGSTSTVTMTPRAATGNGTRMTGVTEKTLHTLHNMVADRLRSTAGSKYASEHGPKCTMGVVLRFGRHKHCSAGGQHQFASKLADAAAKWCRGRSRCRVFMCHKWGTRWCTCVRDMRCTSTTLGKSGVRPMKPSSATRCVQYLIGYESPHDC